MNVKQRLKLLAIISLIAITSLTLVNVYKEYQYMTKLKKVQDLVSISKQISTVMDHVQNERSISAIYIQSNGQMLVDELDHQRKQTDLQITLFNNLIKQYQLINQNPLLQKNINKIVQSFQKLSTIRNQIDRLKLSIDGMFSFYNTINRPILHIIALNANQSPAGNISKELSAYYFFLKAKEIASVQKAIFSALFISENFTETLFDQTISLIAKEQSYLDVFESLAPKVLTDIYQTKENINVFKDSYAFSQNVIKSAKAGNFDVDLEIWFGIITKKSEILKTIDKKAIDKIAQDINQTPSIALYSALLGIIFLIIILFVIYGVHKEISKRIHSFDWIIDHKS